MNHSSCGKISILFLIVMMPTSIWAKEPLANPLFFQPTFLPNQPLAASTNSTLAIASEPTHSTGGAFLKSLLLPGWGEYSAGAKDRAKGFLVAEGILWSSFTAFEIYGKWKHSDMANLAVERAGVNNKNKNNTFYSHVSNYQDIEEYNEEMRRFRRYDDVYPIDADHFWRWQTETDREQFDRLHLSSQLAFRNATLVVGGILVNHFLSAIDAIWVTYRANRSVAANFRITPTLTNQGELIYNLSLMASW